MAFLLACVVRAANRPPEYDSDDEFIAPRQQIRQPFLNRQPAPATGVPVAGAIDQRPPIRNDAWSTRMREKVWFPFTKTHTLMSRKFECRILSRIQQQYESRVLIGSQ